jgi:iron complex transport system substrate-binding protein
MIPDPMTGRWLRLLSFVLVASCLLLETASCSRESGTSSAKRRIVSVGGTVTETVFALGAGDEVVAIDTSSVYPEATTKLPKVGYQRTLSTEGILAFSPDLVIVTEDAGPPSVLEQLRSAGVHIERVPSPKSIDSAAEAILAVGKALDLPATELAEKVRREARAASERALGDGLRFVMMFARGAGAMMIAGGDTAASAMVELAGGRNAVGDISGYKPLSAEILIAAAPEVIVVPARGLATMGGVDGVLSVPGVADTPAGRARRIVPYDDLLLLGFGPRLPLAIDELARLLRAPTAGP